LIVIWEIAYAIAFALLRMPDDKLSIILYRKDSSVPSRNQFDIGDICISDMDRISSKESCPFMVHYATLLNE
jgi:hypothetical protein